MIEELKERIKDYERTLENELGRMDACRERASYHDGQATIARNALRDSVEVRNNLENKLVSYRDVLDDLLK